MHKFMEQDLGWRTLRAKTCGHSVHYLMQEPGRGGHYLDLEVKADDTCELTLDGETRVIPSRQDIGVALNLNKTATKLQQGRILSQVIDELIRRHRTVTQADVQDMMEKFARGHL